MKTVLTFFVASLLLLVTQSFQCGRGVYSNCPVFKTDTVLLNTSITNPALEYHLYDTIWLSSTVTDTYSPLSGNPASFTKATDVLYLTIQPYAILTNNSLPSLQVANIEFNPVVREGLLQFPGYMGYIYQYRRQAPNNTLIAGLVPGRTGLYLIELNPGTYVYSSFSLYNPGDQCTTYSGVSNVPTAQQNKSYWNGLGVTALSTAVNYGSHTISINMRNYLIVKVIP